MGRVLQELEELRIDGTMAKGDDWPMNIDQIDKAVHRGVPFRLKVTDGDEYRVPHPDYIFVPPKSSAKRTYVMVHSDEGFASVLPLLTITSLSFKDDKKVNDVAFMTLGGCLAVL